MVNVALLAALGPSALGVRQTHSNLVPPEPLPLGGYTSRTEKPAEPDDPLGVWCTVLESGPLRLAIASVDLLTIPESLYEDVRKRLPKDVSLFLVATHTHCAPDSQMLNARMTIKVPGIAKFERRWLEWYADKIAAAIADGLRENPSAVEEAFALQARVTLNRARRQGAQPDTMATQVGFRGVDPWGYPVKPTLFSSYSAHAVFFGPDTMVTRWDWPGWLAWSTLAPVMPGAIGDVSPYAPVGETPAERVLSFVREFLRSIDERGKVTRVWAPGEPLRVNEVPIRLDPSKPHPEFSKRYGVPDALAQVVVKQFAPPQGTVRAFRIGKLAVVGIPGEPTAELGRKIQEEGRRIGFWPVLTISHVNGWIGYILTPTDYDRGGYEATLSFHGRDTGDRVFEASREALVELAGKPLIVRPKPGTPTYRETASSPAPSYPRASRRAHPPTSRPLP